MNNKTIIESSIHNLDITPLFSDPWVSIFSAMIGAFLGSLFAYFFSIRLLNRKGINIEKGFYNEWGNINEYFKNWLVLLIEEYSKIKVQSYTDFSPYTLNLLDALVLEMISAGKPLTGEQRQLLSNIHNKYASIRVSDDVKRSFVKENDLNDKNYFITPIRLNARHILDAVEIILNLECLIQERENFQFIDNIGSNDIRAVLLNANIDLKKISVEKIIKDASTESQDVNTW